MEENRADPSTPATGPHHARRTAWWRAAKDPATRRWFTRRRAITFSLLVATAGQAIPWGSQDALTGDSGVHLNPTELGLTIAAAVVVVLLAVDLFLPRENVWRKGAWSYALAGFVWITIAAYDALFPGPTWEWHLGHTLTDLGLALIALHQWRFTALGKETHR